MKILDVEITNPDKIIYGDIKKIDVVKYYQKVAKFMLPFVEKRPLSVIRCHNCNFSECFFKKHPTTESENVDVVKVGDEDYFYVDQEKDIIYQAQMGTLEFHCWASDIKNLDKPNIMVFDLDPDEKLGLEKLRQGVRDLKQILDELGLVSFLKTSGGKGYHIVVPFEKSESWEVFSNFAKQVALLMEAKWKDKYTSNIRKSERGGKIFIDWLRNTKGATCVAPYSLRARDGLTVSMPIRWEDLDKIAPNEVNLKTVSKHLKSQVWKNFFSVKQSLG